ncbi:hypothetical protein [Pseudomonas syringae]|uniref:hypothetical protein n=2 Tax=Pseudomonas syringae TaxID=317 RepID=UPI000D47130C|nr:hypothetical protein [Pseudomonas syringae]MCH5528344.1 hypothetical protein [Pseudomonas syringae pv. syringae]MCH5539010.1 hypothetical protein [Pseudomonas syringae pv. syringae]MCH5544026.1 hypothetical protein [Pseudomonas syringae pv. syringae]MCH5601746.1 hypothetical protein [Pseudomonas syringae pv. syringae]MCH5607222.1 hypothetical protein [Pseudomonas syringae pv. syringae]
MAIEEKGLPFLALLDLADKNLTKLAFSKIAAGGKVENHKFLCANSLATKSLCVYFQPQIDNNYAMIVKEVPAKYLPQAKVAEDKAPMGELGTEDDWFYIEDEEDPPTQPAAPVPAPAAPATQPPKQEVPVYLGINEQGWVHATTNSGWAYLAQISGYKNIEFSIDRTDAQDVYLKSWRSKNFMQTYKREDFPNKAWFAWMTDCDGTDAVLKLTIIERYNADGSVKK